MPDSLSSKSPQLERLSDLRVFLQIAESGGITAAARAMGVSKNHVSRRLGALEEQLGVVLARRTTRSVTLTPEGELLYDSASHLLERVRRLEAGLTAMGTTVRGQVRVSLPTMTLDLGLLDRLQRLLAEHPGLAVQIDLSDSPPDPVESGYDLVLVIGRPDDTSHIARRLTTLAPALAATPAYLDKRGRPCEPAELSSHDCLLFVSDRSQAAWRLLGPGGHELTVPVTGSVSSRDSRLLREALYRGMGIGVRPEWEVRQATERGELEPVLPAYQMVPLEVWVLMPQRVQRVPRVRALADLLTTMLVEIT